MNLKIKIGCDIVNINRFSKILDKGSKVLLNNLFSQYEITNSDSIKSLAGIFAAKESVIKALELKPGNWNLIEIIKQENGKPATKLNNLPDKTIISSDISISHDGDYVIATSCFLITDK